MRILPLAVAVAAALGLAACGDDAPKQGTTQSNAPASSAPDTASTSVPTSPPGTPQSSSGSPGTTSSATPGEPTQAEKREGANPTQGQVDPKDKDQQKDFQQSGDRAGPTSGDTQPKPGN